MFPFALVFSWKRIYHFTHAHVPLTFFGDTKRGLCALRYSIQVSMEAIMAFHPAKSTEWLDWAKKSCELWRNRTGPTVRACHSVRESCKYSINTKRKSSKLIISRKKTTAKLALIDVSTFTGRFFCLTECIVKTQDVRMIEDHHQILFPSLRQRKKHTILSLPEKEKIFDKEWSRQERGLDKSEVSRENHFPPNIHWCLPVKSVSFLNVKERLCIILRIAYQIAKETIIFNVDLET